ncbi:helix-hairpin-helix domain-containing protein [candidate division WOR-3 bacterium]|jgi:competence protein ComEA|nr:helix-hairpin-helix domain-containing protein [candidate division WOR-3 bacterium]
MNHKGKFKNTKPRNYSAKIIHIPGIILKYLDNILTFDEQKAIFFVFFIIILGKSIYPYVIKEIKMEDKREQIVSKNYIYNKNRKSKKNVDNISFPISINEADKSSLMDIPGIGEKTAGYIIQYRDKYKGFKKIEDLKKIKGIGDKKIKKIRKYVKL